MCRVALWHEMIATPPPPQAIVLGVVLVLVDRMVQQYFNIF